MREPSVADTLRASVCHNTLRGILQYSMGVYMTRAKGVARPMSDLLVSRRRLLRAGALGAGALALPAWARGADLPGGFIRPGFDEVSGRDISLTIGEGPRVVPEIGRASCRERVGQDV